MIIILLFLLLWFSYDTLYAAIKKENVAFARQLAEEREFFKRKEQDKKLCIAASIGTCITAAAVESCAVKGCCCFCATCMCCKYCESRHLYQARVKNKKFWQNWPNRLMEAEECEEPLERQQMDD